MLIKPTFGGIVQGAPLSASLGALGASNASRWGTSFILYLIIFLLWDTEPGILNDTLNDPSLPPPHLWFTYLGIIDTKVSHSNLLEETYINVPKLIWRQQQFGNTLTGNPKICLPSFSGEFFGRGMYPKCTLIKPTVPQVPCFRAHTKFCLFYPYCSIILMTGKIFAQKP